MISRALWVSLVVVATAAGCPREIVEDVPDAGNSGQQFLVCSDVSECLAADPNATEQTVRCDGVCLYICNGVDEACPAESMFCDVNGTCAFGCRDSSRCNQDAGEVCRAGICQVSAAECTSKCDCNTGDLCVDELCVPATSDTCQGSEQCPRGPKTPTDKCEAYACNGFTDTCFDPAPAQNACTQPSDCLGRPGCLGGTTCTCTESGACVSDATCTVQNEVQTCGFGNFCDANSRCQPLPACTQPSDCSGGLVCNSGTGFCERSQPCTANTDCTIAPNTQCANNFCTIPTCLNGGQTCTAPLTCSAQGRCTQPGTGVACTGNGDCQSDQYCDLTECRVGCRNNESCPAGQNCNGNHQCAAPGGGGGGLYGDPCVDETTQLPDDGQCQSGLICGTVTGQCAEQCVDASECVACNARNGGACRCNFFGFCVL